MDSEIQVAVIGCGYWGPNLLRNLNALDRCRVSHACDREQDRLNHIKALYPDLRVTRNEDEIIDNPDIQAVAIATPVRTHYSLARRCLAAGKHVFVEKPMAASVSECEDLVREADARGLCLMVGHTFLYSQPVRTLRDIYDSGELGDMLYISARRLNLGLFQKDINVAWDLAPHDISIVLFVLKDTPVWVSCQGKASIHKGVEDVSAMMLMFSSGVMAMIQSSWLDPNKVREITFVGNRKMLVYNDIETTEKIKIYDMRVEAPPHYDNFGEFHYSYHYGDMCSPYIKQVEPLRVECQHFVDSIRKGVRPMTDGRNGLQVVRILEAATKSLRNSGAKVALNTPVPAATASLART